MSERQLRPVPKKKPSRSPRKATPPRSVIDGLYEAEELLEGGQPAEAARLLEELDRRHPGYVPVLEMLAGAYFDSKDMSGYEWACYRLLQVDNSNADVALALGGAYIENLRPALAIRALEHFLRRWPNHERAAEALCWLHSSSIRISRKWRCNELENRVLCGSILKPIWSWQHDPRSHPFLETICQPCEAACQTMEQAHDR